MRKMKGYIWQMEIFHHDAVSLQTKYEISHEFHKSHAFTLFLYIFICLFSCFVYFKFLPFILLQKSFLILNKMHKEGKWKCTYDSWKSCITPMYYFIQNIKVFTQGIKVIHLYYIFILLFVHLGILIILISSYDLHEKSFLIFHKVQAGGWWKSTYRRWKFFITPRYHFIQNITVFMHRMKILL